MLNIKSLIDRCDEIIEVGKVYQYKEGDAYLTDISRINSSIENIYEFCFPQGIPDHLKLSNYIRTLTNLGISQQTLGPFEIFRHRLRAFEEFKKDLERGIITRDLSNIIIIDLFSDMLEQAESLRSNKTEPLNRAACVLARIVLEDSLKKVCENNNYILSTNKASEANDRLKKENIIPQAQWRFNQARLDVGNAAAHPGDDFSSIDDAQIDDMIDGVKEFVSKYL
ncbi:MAG: DUF4145 domain-containing protein [Candidatus Odinarchaeota archaeon]